MSDFSPTAQKVLDAAFSVYNEEACLYVISAKEHAGMVAAAAIRAAIDQALPEEHYTDSDYDFDVWETRQHIRDNLLKIASELLKQRRSDHPTDCAVP